MNPYEVLKVKRTATKAQITRAYRKLAMKFHPDRGGDAEAFKEIHKAYAILSDDVKRARYDQDGTTETRDEDSASLGILSDVFVTYLFELLQSNRDPAKQNVLDEVKRRLESKLFQSETNTKSVRAVLKKLQGLPVRLSNTDGQTFLIDVLKIKIAELERGIEQNANEQKILKRSLDLLVKYRFDFDGRPSESWPPPWASISDRTTVPV